MRTSGFSPLIFLLLWKYFPNILYNPSKRPTFALNTAEWVFLTFHAPSMTTIFNSNSIINNLNSIIYVVNQFIHRT